MPGRTWTRGDATTTAKEAVKTKPAVKSSPAQTKKRQATWSREDGEAKRGGNGKEGTQARLRASAAAFEPASAKAQREALEAKMKAVEAEKAKLKAALEAAAAKKAQDAREKKEKEEAAKADAARRQRAAGNLLSGFRGVRKQCEERVDEIAKPVENLSQEEIERRAVQRVVLAGTDWQVLDLPPGSQKKWVTKSYRELAKILHPDKCAAPGAKEAFQKLNKAYKALL